MSKTFFKGFIALLVMLVAVAGFGFSAVQPVQAALKYDPSVCAGSAELPELTPECVAMIKAFPRPVVAPIAQDRFTLSNYSFWRVGPEPVAQFDAPGGNVIGEIPAGFNFVNAIDTSVDGWIQIEGGQWISQANATYRQPSYFTGVKLLNGLDHPFAFVLDMSRIYVSEKPGAAASKETGRFLERYELVNIFDVAEDSEGWRWYMIGENQWVKQTFVGKIQKTERPEGVTGRWVAVDLYEQTLVAYENDTPVFATLVATGIPPYDTNEGLFTVWESLSRDPMSGATGAPEAYALQMVPWVMYFDGGISLHGTYWHDLFGYRQSHGCVNLSIMDAWWIYDFTKDEPHQNAWVYVYSSGQYRRDLPAWARR